jgi:hypothetical protein
MNSISITGRGIKAFVNTTVIYSTVELKEKRLWCNTVTMANCGFLSGEMCDGNHCLTVCLSQHLMITGYQILIPDRALYHVHTQAAWTSGTKSWLGYRYDQVSSLWLGINFGPFCTGKET